MKISTSYLLGIVLVLCLLNCGMAVITTNPTNVTICEGSPAVFTCVINETLTINWLINGQQPLPSPPTTLLTPGPGAQSTLSVTATSQLNGASVQCYYSPSVLVLPTVSPPAYLSVQAPPSAPTNLTTTVLNDTSVLLAWGPPLGTQTHITYIVVVASRNGSVVYNVTVGELQVTINTDPCDQYEATVSAVLSSCIGNSKSVSEETPSIGNSEISYGPYSEDKVTINISFFRQPGICKYVATSIATDHTGTFSSEPSFIIGNMTNIISSLPLEKKFTSVITAYNAFGNSSVNLSINTFSVVDITGDTAGLNCTYYHNSQAIGCLLNATSLNGVVHCIIIPRYSSVVLKKSLCSSNYSNNSLSAGTYFLMAFGIYKNEIVSHIQALNKTLTLSLQSTDQPVSTSSVQTQQVMAGVAGGVVGGLAIIAIIAAVFAVMVIIHNRKYAVTLHGTESTQKPIEASHTNPSDARSNYAVVQLPHKVPFSAPSGEDIVFYSSVKI